MNIKKLKVIHIVHCSHSYFANDSDDLKKIILNDWNFKVAYQIKKFYPEIELECWAPEKTFNDYKEWQEGGIKLKFFPVKFSPRYALDFSPEMGTELKKEIKKAEKDKKELIIHIHEIHNLQGLYILTKFRKQKILVQHHGGSPPFRHLKTNKKYWIFSPFFLFGQIWENRVLKNAKIYYALSKEEIEYLKKRTKSKIKFQTMGIGDEYYGYKSKNQARKILNIPRHKKILLFMGRVSKIKGVDYLIQAMKSIPEANLYILGYGEERKELENLSKNLNLKNVKFCGGIFGEEKLSYLSAADALILPSLKEGAPVTVMEAIARNLPVVITNVGGVSLMIQNKREGIIIKKGESEEIVRGVNEVLKWKNKKIKKYAEKYRWAKIIKETVKDYYTMIS